MFIRIIEFSALALLVYFLLTQVIVPAVLERKLFPIFRKTGKLEEELIEAKQETLDLLLEAEVVETRSKTAEIKAVKNETKIV